MIWVGKETTITQLLSNLCVLLNGIDIWVGDHLDKSPVLYSLGSQAGVVDIKHASHL